MYCHTNPKFNPRKAEYRNSALMPIPIQINSRLTTLRRRKSLSEERFDKMMYQCDINSA